MTPDETLEQTDSKWGEQVKVLCRSFREQWQSGDSPSVKDWLTKVAGSQRESLFRELLAADIDCRLAQGEPIESSVYLGEFPQYCDAIQEVFSEANPTSVASNFHADGTELVTSTGDKSPSHQVGESTPSPPGYEILNEIARGGMGVVYKAQQHRPQRIVALKMVLAGRRADEAERKRFFAEAEAAAKLNHPGIVPIIEVGEHQGLPFFSMRFVGGKDLRTETSEQLPAPRAAAQWLVQVSQAVAYAHNQGVIHRDLKPANILLDEKGQPLITDFGLAKRIDVESDLTLSGQVLGTPRYMAPEQAAGNVDAIGPHSDIYALGAVLYYLLVGRPPFMAGSTVETLRQVINDEPAAPRQLDPTIPVDLETICLKCLEKNPNRRYESAAALGDDLERFLGGREILARPATLPDRAMKWVRRNPAVSLSLAATLAILLLGVSVSSYFAVAASREATVARDSASEARIAEKKAELARNAALDAADSEKKFRQIAEDALKETAALAKSEAKARADAEAAAARAEAEKQIAIKERDRAQFIAYSFRIDEARRLIEQNKAHMSMDVLESTNTEVRGWEYGFVMQQLLKTPSREGLKTAQQKSICQNACFTDNGRLAVTGKDESVLLLDASTGKVERELVGHKAHVVFVAASADESIIASAALAKKFEHEIIIWETAEAKIIQRFRVAGSLIREITLSNDLSKVAVVARGAPFALYEIATGKAVPVPVPGLDMEVHSARFSSDDQRLVVGCKDRAVRIWNLQTGKMERAITGLAFDNSIACLSPDQSQLLTVSCNGNFQREPAEVALWSTITGEKIYELKDVTRSIHDVAFSPDGRRFATCTWVNVAVYDAETGAKALSLRQNVGSIDSVQFSPDGETILTWSHLKLNGNNGWINVWDGDVGQSALSLSCDSPVTFVRISPNGKMIAAVSADGMARIWDAESHQLLHKIKAHSNSLSALAISHDSKWIATAGVPTVGVADEIFIWSTATGELERTIDLSQAGFARRTTITSLAFGPTNETLVSTGLYHFGLVWDTATGKLLPSPPHGAETLSFGSAIEPQGEHLIAGITRNLVYDKNGQSQQFETIEKWNLLTGENVFTLKDVDAVISCVDIRKDGEQFVVASPKSGSGGPNKKNSITIRRCSDGAIVKRIPIESPFVNAARFSPDGSLIASAHSDGSVRIYDAMSGRLLDRLTGHTSVVNSLSFSPDGRSLASASSDTTIRIWDVSEY